MTVSDLHNRLNKEGGRGFHFLAYMYERWVDEREYEDINDYLNKIKEIIPEAYEIDETYFTIMCKKGEDIFKIEFEEDGENGLLIKINRGK